jgi:1A family penicillin-binding protein
MTQGKKSKKGKKIKIIKPKHLLLSSGKKGLFSHKIFIVFLFLLLLNFILISAYLFKDLPTPGKIETTYQPLTTQIFDRNGKLLYGIYAEQNRKPISLTEIPEYLKKATIAIEDKDFYHHKGFSLPGILRAAFKTVFKKKLEGGSTITQQLVKSAALTQERTITRKIKELILSTLVEIKYSKDQILEMYFNQVPYGGTAWGIEAAAETYFAKPAKDLSLAESTLLAGLPAAPTRFSPFGANPQLAKDRQQAVLRRMVEDGYITKEEAEKAAEEKLQFAPQKTDILAPHFVMYIKEFLVEKYGQKMVEQGGLKVFTSLDLDIQEKAQEIVTQEVEKIRRLKVGNGAAIITKPNTGEILAMVGSKDYFNLEEDGNVNVCLSRRQPGSSIKPINYAVAFLKGYTPATFLVDYPTCFDVPGQPLYCPVNYDGQFHGPVQVRFALGNSYNLPAVKMLAINTLESFVSTASAMGITTFQDPSNYGLSITLGGGEVKMIDMAVAFGVFANSGVKKTLHPILKIEDKNGLVIEELKEQAGERILPPEVAFMISDVLSDNNARIPMFGPSSDLVIKDHPHVAVKTGTTNDKRDNWTLGYTPSYLTAVWVGNNDNTPMGHVASGMTGASPIFNKIMTSLLLDLPDEPFHRPSQITTKSFCTGPQDPNIPEGENCTARTEYFAQNIPLQKNQGGFERKQIWIDRLTSRPPLPNITENLELQEHLVAFDPLVGNYCIDCPHDQNEPHKVINPYQTPPEIPQKNQPPL